MKNILWVLIGVLMLSSVAEASKKQTATVHIATQTEDRAFKFSGSGLIGAIQGSKTEDLVFMVNAVINGDHARLKCYENHRGCTALGPGDYEAQIDKDNVWIITTMPVSHKEVRDHWKVSGSW